MNKDMVRRMKERIPAFTEKFVEGLAYDHMMGRPADSVKNNTMLYIERVIRVNEPLFPPGLRFEGSRMCSPYEHFEKTTQEFQSKRTCNIAKYDTYMVEYNFSFDPGDGNRVMLMPRYVLLPFCRPGGITHLNGAKYVISPVLADIGYSVSRNSIFVPFRRVKLTFKRVDYRFEANGKLEICRVIWSTIHQERHNRKTSDRNDRPDLETSIIHYFFCEFGLKETFKRWGNADVEIVHRNDLGKYPKSKYMVFESCTLKGRHPAGDVCLVLPKEQYTEFTKMLVGGYFYVVDTFPSFFMEIPHIDQRDLWRTIMGMMIFGDFEHRGKLAEDMDNHMLGFASYLDEMTKEDLADAGIKVNNIWELFYAIMTDLVHHFYQSNRDETSMYGKRLTVLRYVLEEFNAAISSLAFNFQSRRDLVWTVPAVEKVLKDYLKLNTAIRYLTSSHNEISNISYPGDNKIFRITSMIVPQDQARAVNTHNRGLINDSSRLLDASIAEVGQYKNQPKTAPDGRARGNPNIQIDDVGNVIRREDIRPLIDSVQARIQRKQ